MNECLPKRKVEVIGNLALDWDYKTWSKCSLFSCRAPNLGSRQRRRTGEGEAAGRAENSKAWMTGGPGIPAQQTFE